jgi:hypothetical protein
MKQLHRLSVSIFIIAALSLTPAAHAIDITIADSSTAGSEINPGTGPTVDEVVATEPSFPEPTSVGASGFTASADWAFENNTTSAVFSADAMVAEVSQAGTSSRNYVSLEFTLPVGVDYYINGGIHWRANSLQKIAASLVLSLKGAVEPILVVDQSFPYIGAIDIEDFSSVASGDTSGFLAAGTYTLEFSVAAVAGFVSGLNSITGDFSVTLGDLGGSSEPLIGGAPIDGFTDWYSSDWFGDYNTTQAPWLFHSQHGFLYRFGESSNDNMFVYDEVMGAWWWTNETVYPFIYAFDPPADIGGTDIDSAWLWYDEGTVTPRWFVVLTGPNTDSWLSFNP